MATGAIETFDRGDGLRLAYERIPGAAPAFVWLSGFRSHMGGTKAETLAQWAKAKGWGFLRFDYAGHGQSDGRFEQGTISSWTRDALTLIDALTDEPLILVGSSMGGWISLLIAAARPARVKSLLLIAPAPDFTERLLKPSLSAEALAEIAARGRWDMPSPYDPEPTPITRALLEDGARNLVLNKPIAFDGPVRILHGAADPDVPAWLVNELFAALPGQDKIMRTVPDGDYRLSRPEDLALLLETAAALAGR